MDKIHILDKEEQWPDFVAEAAQSYFNKKYNSDNFDIKVWDVSDNAKDLRSFLAADPTSTHILLSVNEQRLESLVDLKIEKLSFYHLKVTDNSKVVEVQELNRQELQEKLAPPAWTKDNIVRYGVNGALAAGLLFMGYKVLSDNLPEALPTPQL